MAKKQLRVGMIGYGFMGRAHSNAYKQVGQFFPSQLRGRAQGRLRPQRGQDQEVRRRSGATSRTETDWRKLVERKDIDVIDICTPNNLHKEIALAAAANGKMILCEKPLAMNAAEGREMVAAVEKAGVPNMVWYNYRRIPAVTLAKKLIDEGRLGRIFHYRAKFLQDWTIKADLPQGGQGLWRLDVAAAGRGVTGDLLAHCIDTAIWLNGRIDSVCAMTETFVKERMHNLTGKVEKVGIDDACTFMGRFANGSLANFESTRYARGHKARVHVRDQRREHVALLGPARPAPAPGVRLQGRGEDPRLEERPRDRQQPGPPVHGELVGAGPADRLRRQLHAPGGRLHPGSGDRQAAEPDLQGRARNAVPCSTPCSTRRRARSG